MEVIKKHSTKILIGLGAAVFLFGGYYLLKPSQVQKEISTNNSSIMTNNSSRFSKGPSYNQVINNVRSFVEKDRASGLLSKQTVMAINQSVIILFKDSYINMIIEGRLKRRAKIDNKLEFTQILLENTKTAENLMQAASKEVLDDLNVSMQLYERSSDEISKTDPQFAMINLYMIESIKTQIPSKRHQFVSKEELVEIMKFQLSKFKTEDFKQFNLPPQESFLVKQTYISDLASLKYMYEEEDLMRNPTILQDPDVQNVQREIQMHLQQEQMSMGNMF